MIEDHPSAQGQRGRQCLSFLLALGCQRRVGLSAVTLLCVEPAFTVPGKNKTSTHRVPPSFVIDMPVTTSER